MPSFDLEVWPPVSPPLALAHTCLWPECEVTSDRFQFCLCVTLNKLLLFSEPQILQPLLKTSAPLAPLVFSPFSLPPPFLPPPSVHLFSTCPAAYTAPIGTTGRCQERWDRTLHMAHLPSRGSSWLQGCKEEHPA